MASRDILFLVLTVSTAVITVVVVWLANDLIVILRNIKKMSRDTQEVVDDFKQKTLMVGEALDRMGDSATRILGIIEDSESELKSHREKIKDGVGLIAKAEKITKDKTDGAKSDKDKKGEKD